MVAHLAQVISQVLPFTVGDGMPQYRIPFLSSANPSKVLSEMATDTQNTYRVNPYIGDPIHKFSAQI